MNMAPETIAVQSIIERVYWYEWMENGSCEISWNTMWIVAQKREENKEYDKWMIGY